MTCPGSEFSDEFVRGMKNRMEVSYHKYGPVADAYPHKVDAIESAEARIQKYRETGNTEWLMDSANFLMIEFMRPGHPNAHFRATDSNESGGRFSRLDGETDKSNRDLDGWDLA
jgi:hypothetical protein